MQLPSSVDAALHRVDAGENLPAVARDLGMGATTLRRYRRLRSGGTVSDTVPTE